MPPFRLYIVISFVLFLVLSLSARDSIFFDTEDDVAVTSESVTRDIEVAVPPEYRDDVREALEEREAALESEQAGDEPADPAADTGDDDGFQVDLGGENGPEWLQQIEHRIEDNAGRARDDPADFIDALIEYLPQMMFLMLPIFALLLKILYLFSPFHYLQHLVFSLHYHSFVYLLYLLSTLLERVGWQLGDFFALLLLIYLPLALRKTYRSSWGGAIGKSLVLCISYAVVLILGFAGVAITVLALL